VALVGFTATGRTAALVETVSGAEGSGRVAVAVALGVGAAAVAAVAAIVLGARSERNRTRALVTRLSSDAYADYVAGVLERFVGDLQRVAGTRGGVGRVAASSVVIWTLDVVTATLVLAAFDVSLAPLTLLSVGFFAVSVGNLAKVLPLSPGGIGLYEGAFTLLVVGLTPVGPATAFGAAVLDHAVKNVVTVGGGVGSMLALNVSLATAVEESGDVREGADDVVHD
jgi:uncharacterized protein (TIRG00374 family)